MKIKVFFLIAVISICLISCNKENIGSKLTENNVTIRGNDTWVVAGREFDGNIPNYNRINLIGSNVIYFTVSAKIEKVPLECYFSIDGTNVRKTVQFSWDATKNEMSLAVAVNVTELQPQIEYKGHIVINGNSKRYHQQTDYIVHKNY